MADYVIELAAPPSTRAAFRRAALDLVLRRKGTATGTPDTTFVLCGVTVHRGHLAAYDEVCGYRLADRLPPTYPHVLAFPLALHLMSTPGFPLPLAGIVHVANRIEVLRPVDAGERLDLAVRAADLRAHERGRQVDLLATATVDGEVVWRGVSTYLRREKSAESRGEPRERPAPPAASAVWRVGREVGPRYAAVSGDRNPIHTSRLAARALGFPRTIAHGMWSKARCLAALEGRLPERYTVDVAFKLPVLLPATVDFSSVPADGGWSVALHGHGSGRPHLVGTVS
jgi:acyl dehydratase